MERSLSSFQCIFQNKRGLSNGIVSAMGGLGGLFPPIILSFLFNLTGHYAIGYMALSEVALALFNYCGGDVLSRTIESG